MCCKRDDPEKTKIIQEIEIIKQSTKCEQTSSMPNLFLKWPARYMNKSSVKLCFSNINFFEDNIN